MDGLTATLHHYGRLDEAYRTSASLMPRDSADFSSRAAEFARAGIAGHDRRLGGLRVVAVIYDGPQKLGTLLRHIGCGEEVRASNADARARRGQLRFSFACGLVTDMRGTGTRCVRGSTRGLYYTYMYVCMYIYIMRARTGGFLFGCKGSREHGLRSRVHVSQHARTFVDTCTRARVCVSGGQRVSVSCVEAGCNETERK
jgi:hypothetical protein